MNRKALIIIAVAIIGFFAVIALAGGSSDNPPEETDPGNGGFLESVPTQKISLKSMDLAVYGHPITLSATVYPENSTEKIIWTSSDETTATVENGIVTAKGYGPALITAKSGSVSADCLILVENLVNDRHNQNIANIEANRIARLVPLSETEIAQALVLWGYGQTIADSAADHALGDGLFTAERAAGWLARTGASGEALLDLMTARGWPEDLAREGMAHPRA